MSSNNGPFIIVEDDLDDQEVIRDILQTLKITNTILLFTDGTEALTYLQTMNDQPFLILCDMNLPKMNGLELRAAINNNEKLRKKSIPFVFFSTNASPDAVQKAYDLTVQGFFLKASTYQELEETLSLIIQYWRTCKHPNS